MNRVPDALIYRNATLSKFIQENRREQLDFLLDLQCELNSHANPVGVKIKYGIAHTDRSVMIDRYSNPFIGRLIAGFESCLNIYKLTGIEVWLGDSRAVPFHNDANVYLEAGQNVALQFWVLLESCVLDEGKGNEIVDAVRDKNALECLLPIAPGILYPGMKRVLTPEGLVDFPQDHVVGGDELMIGDILMFKNGVIHFKRPGINSTFRGALAFRAILKDMPDRLQNNEHMIWFRELLRTHPSFRESQSGNAYFRTFLKSLEALPERHVDISKLKKIDSNDYDALQREIEGYNFCADKYAEN